MDTGKDTINALGAFAAIAGMAGTLCFAALAGMRLAQGLHPEAAINGTLAVAAAIATWRCIRTARED